MNPFVVKLFLFRFKVHAMSCMRELIRVYPISPVGLLIHIRARGIFPCFTLSIRVGWLHFQLEEESLFRLHPVVSGSFHWEHYFQSVLFYTSRMSLLTSSFFLCRHFVEGSHGFESSSLDNTIL